MSSSKSSTRPSSVYDDGVSASPSNVCESGYASGSSNDEQLPQVHFSKAHLKFLNQQLSKLTPQGK
jgi:phosphoadenosine phosphosulfate reductase